MQLAMVGLGRMGANIVRRLMTDGHDCVVTDHNPDAVAELEAEGATGAEDLADLVDAVPAILEVSIGHALTADALKMGFAAAVTAYRAALDGA